MKSALIKLALATTTALTVMTPAMAQNAGTSSNGGLEEIVVTAQKREQSMQDVPIAVTAVTQESLQANRIHTVNDLSAIAPGLTVKPSAGGIQVPAFTLRGQVSFGVVAGSDKQVSIYLDGVYLANPRGSIFNLPDVQQLEVLRGPQGTLFGRNATAGAVSITTRDPTGDAHAKLVGSYGNQDAYRIVASVDTPQFGPFSAYFSYVRDYRRGDIQNAGAGTVWDRTLSTGPLARKTTSPQWLGTTDSNSYFAAVKFEPSSNFKMVYKYDRTDDHGTPEGSSFVAYDKSLGGGLAGAVLTALYTSNNVYLDPSGKRPDIVANSWVTPRDLHVQGHSLTATWKASDDITVKNIFAYREANVFAPSSIDGVSGLTYTQAVADSSTFLTAVSVLGASFFGLTPAQQGATLANFAPIYQGNVGKRLLVIASGASSQAKQYSDEIQINYSSDKLQATVGAVWFHSNDEAGGPPGLQNTKAFNFTPNCACIIPQTGLIAPGNEGRYFNQATSLAAYVQLEYNITPELTIVGGARITNDKKTSSFRWDVNGVAQPLIVPPAYARTKPNYLIGVNWKPNRDTLVYGKFSTSFVSGGSTAGITYEPEVATSFELGFKADFLDRRLRTNIAVYHVIYNHFQSAGSTSQASSTATILPTLISLYGSTVANNLVGSLSTFVVDNGKLRVNGFEAEVTAAPTRGLTIGGSLSYTDPKFLFIQPNVLAGFGGLYDLRDRPKWTASVYGSYETEPLFGETTLQFRMDGQFRSKALNTSNALIDIYADKSNASVATVPSHWLVNGRVALRHLKIGPADAELSVWGKNLGDNKDPVFVLITPLATSSNYGPDRSYGIELSIDF
ncbi:MAG: TonB-dependent receptor [Novosphingobium sp.]